MWSTSWLATTGRPADGHPRQRYLVAYCSPVEPVRLTMTRLVEEADLPPYRRCGFWALAEPEEAPSLWHGEPAGSSR